MKSTLTKEQDNLVSISMVIPAKEAASAYNTAANRISQYVNIDGFRKGKAPRAVIERHVGVDRIRQEALDIILPKYLGQAVYDNKLDVISQPAITDYKFETGKDLEVTFEVETRPEVKLGEYKNLEVKAEVPSEDDGAFDKALEGFLTQHASMELVLDRPSNETDTVVFDFDGTCNGEAIQGGSAKGYALDLAHSNFIPGFAEQLVDREIDKEFDVNVTFPETYHEQKLAGQPAVFKCVIHEIKTKVMPELTDEFAQKVGPFKTVDELKADIQDYLDKQKEVADKKASEKAILDKIHENTEIDIHDSMIKREADSLLEDYKQKLKTQGFTWEQAVETQGLDKIMETINSDAVFRIKNSLIIDKIAKEEDLKVDQESMNEKFESLSAMYQMDKETFGKYLLQSPGMINNISQQILNEKVINFLVENNKVKFVKAK